MVESFAFHTIIYISNNVINQLFDLTTFVYQKVLQIILDE